MRHKKQETKRVSYTNLILGFDKGTSAGFWVLVGALTVDCVLTA